MNHVVVLPGDGSEFLRCKCLHCGQEGALLLPAGLRTVAGFSRGFTQDHQHCKPRPKPALLADEPERCGLCGEPGHVHDDHYKPEKA
jgi:hypothetical protein